MVLYNALAIERLERDNRKRYKSEQTALCGPTDDVL